MVEKIKILLFGILAEKLNADDFTIDLKKDTEELVGTLKHLYPELDGITFSVAVNKKMISANTPLQPGDEIALLPPFSGG